uniref:Granulins domain-containing protein n=1 Tax=Neogobius melanostomus TaxID=47308 RepID=A0A8C6UTU7_9GOBI
MRSCLKMLRKPLLLLLLCGAVSCSIMCPDGKIKCRSQDTCCLTDQGYKCCPYPNAVCCTDQAHCCPFGFMCDQTTQMCRRSWIHTPLLPQDEAPLRVKPSPLQAGQAPPSDEQAASSVVYCDNYYTCPNGQTCCRHPAGGWTCCPYSPARCCLDGFHCCPYGYDCDYTYTHCIRQGVPHPFSPRRPSTRLANPVDHLLQVSSSGLPAQPAQQTLTALGEESAIQEGGVIRCDAQYHCPKGSSCCQNQNKQWNCCPYPLGVCCADGSHCCQYGYTCDPGSQECRRGFI